MASAPNLHMDSLRLHELAPVRTHSDLLRTVLKGMEELSNGGVLSRRGHSWLAGGVVVAEDYHYQDTQNRDRVAIRFGSWLCLALALKVSREETRKALLDAVKKHPIY